ncbi:hypothetical protein HaLaN_00404 [Haematococcus lacustris]|uniref:Uncharacterized protein n=1 Tax=Haematococcus lacustris TaxID=44745 RepID=A0A699Y6M0_HAELA|nr:hypothetical protein HaLaN_00404 [Haematococcus lacustris]
MHLVHVVCDPRALASSGPRDLVAPSLQIAELLLDRVQAAKARMLVVASHGPGKGGG